MISTRTVDGVTTTTIEEGDWQFQRPGWGAAWVATHLPSGTAIETKQQELAGARSVARELMPDLAPAEPAVPVRYTVDSRFDRRFTGHRRGDPR